MGCAASSDDRAERRRRGRALGHSEASTTGLLVVGPEAQDQEPVAAPWRRRGCKVAPEPKEEPAAAAAEPAMPGSPSFRYYCQKAAAVDALVAEVEAADGEGSVRISEASQAPETNQVTVESTSKSKIVEASKPKQVTKWLRFRGLAIVAAAWYNLFSRHRSKSSTPPSPVAAKSHLPGPAAAARSHT
ncbi:hypothetical protein PR202_gb03906 [Eleusine coracana subsp. coracana]|uniref:Uncharacterized protein n=1 Tax=Eleusine coracana subsp. coracana TaxID=191504 RepID=A0AAV5E2X3_ELECO|nr:hypothetical protein QOZ80_1BG0095040 [Eleusine coracana subsp. coracana]GJN16881.1 hypothetical protein PR202_gb03906 [Eleusine coracana subsp. coracana]